MYPGVKWDPGWQHGITKLSQHSSQDGHSERSAPATPGLLIISSYSLDSLDLGMLSSQKMFY